MADSRLSEEFDALSDKAKETAEQRQDRWRTRKGSTESGRRRSTAACHSDRGAVEGEGQRRLRQGLN